MTFDFESPELEKVVHIINRNRTFLIANPQKPDGDSIGAGIALGLALKALGKKVDLYCPDLVPKKFSYLTDKINFQKKVDFEAYQIIIGLDFPEFAGFKIGESVFNNRKFIWVNIDHHITNAHFADVNLINPSAAACCQIIYYLIKKLSVKVDRDIATALLTGLSTDTGSFRHSNTTPEVLDIASILLSCGAKLNKISSSVYSTKSISALRLWGIALERLRFNEERKIAYSIITKEDFQELNAKLEDLEGAVSLLATIPGNKATILFTQVGNKIKGSIRTENEKVNVANLAGFFGGGGHRKASGFTLNGEITKTPKSWKILLK